MEKEFKSIDMDISYTTQSKHTEVHVYRNAVVRFGTETTFDQINEFLEGCQKIFQSFQFCVKNSLFCKVYLSCAVFDRPEAGSLNTRSFQGWRFEGTPTEGTGDGLYLSPDPQYTNKDHDIYIDFAQPLLSQLAEAHI